MDKIQNIETLICETAILLEKFGETSWASAIRSFGDEIFALKGAERGQSIRKFLRIFSGSGSFSDLVLTMKGNTPLDINDRFSYLKREIHKCLLKML
ncbi:hypothetical protein JXL83_04305 [candidate division WOR-3 bacterium]|nr:hypothetical protein [candidate division WOR-3 bacterium]